MATTLSPRALIVTTRYLGDALLTLPLARALAEAGWHVDAIAMPAAISLLTDQPWVREAFAPDWKSWIRRKRYDAAFIFTPSDRSFAMASLLARKRYAVMTRRYTEWWKHLLAHDVVPFTPTRHMASYSFSLARLAGVGCTRSVPFVFAEDDWLQAKNSLSGWEKGSFLAFHPWTPRRYKRWPLEHWKELIRRATRSGWRVAITTSPSETELARDLAEDFDSSSVRVVLGLGWRALAALYHAAGCFVAVDTFNAHLAAAVNAHVVTIFGPSLPQVWGPWPNGWPDDTPWQAHAPTGVQQHSRIVLVQHTMPCVPCGFAGCERHPESPSQCLQTLSPGTVWREVERCLNA